MTTIQRTTKNMTNDISNRFKRRGSELLDDAQDQGQRALRNSRTWVSRNPVAAVGYAFLAGTVLTLIFGRRRSVPREY
jgi:ElaB/YqjD/DUF883 family membrane-anchored ribosome-binding protein